MTRQPLVAICSTRPSSVATLHQLVDKHFPDGEGQEWRADLHVIVDEMASNVEKYAYPEGRGEYELHIVGVEGRVEITLTDQGEAFDPTLVKEDPLAGESDRPPGGMGILLVRALAESMEYRREGGRNITKIVLPLSGKEIYS
jgi:anti-sigma regulatory factor (Ser/Thr protein kinase)